MKLAAWARRQGISYMTCLALVKDDAMPVPWRQTAQTAVALYAHVSSHDHRGDLDRQLARLPQYAADQQLPSLNPSQKSARY